MASRSLNVVITGDSRGFSTAVRKVEEDTDRLDKRLKLFSRSTDDAGEGISELGVRVGAFSGSIGSLAPVLATATPALLALGGAAASVGASLAAAAGGAGALGVGLGAALAPILVLGKQVTSRFDDIKKAYGAVTKAQVDGTAASKKAADEQLSTLSKSERAMVASMGKLSDLQKKVLGPASDRIIGSLSKAIDTLAPSLERLAKPFAELGFALGANIERVANVLSGPAWSGAFKKFIETATTLVRPLTSIILHIGSLFRDIAVAALPMVSQAMSAVARMFYALDRAATTSKIRDVVHGLVDQTRSWFNLFAQVGELIFRVFSGGAQQGKGLVDSLTAIVARMNDFLSSDKGRDALIRFFDLATGAVRRFADGVRTVVGLIKDNLASIIPVVVSLAGAFAALKVLSIVSNMASAAALAFRVLTVAMLANPFAAVAVGLTALGGVLLANKARAEGFGNTWRSVSAWVSGAWQTVRNVFTGGDKSATSSINHIIANGQRMASLLTAFVHQIGQAVSAVFSNSGIGGDLAIIGRAFLRFQAVASDVIVFVARRTLPIIVGAIQGLATIVRGVVRIIAGILSGDFSKAWDGAKDVVRGSIKIIVSIVKGLAGLLLDAAKKAGAAIGNGIVSGLGSLGHLLLSKVGDALGYVTKNIPGLGTAVGVGKAIGSLIGDGVGKTARGVLPSGGAFGGSLMGAQTALKPFAAIGSRFGLSVSSGRRPGSITSSGNVSYHSSGEAIDMADGRGPDANKMNFFRYMKSRFGGQLAELIYGPGQVGVKDGRPYNFGPALNAQHMDHVHVAFDTGKPGVGDGIGQIKALWTQAGGSSSAQNIAAAVAMAESGGDPTISNRNSDGSIDRGLWQINSVHGAQSTFNRLGNAKAAVSISSNGRNWNPWTVFKTGAYKRFLGAAGGTKADGGAAGKSGPKQIKGGTAGGGGIGGYNPGAIYGDDGGDPFTPSDAASTQAFIDAQSGKQPLTRPLKGGGPTKGRTQEEKDALAAGAPPAGPTLEDFLNANVSRARLTDGTDDDITALQALLGLRKTEMDKALGDADPRNDGDAIDAFLAVKDALTQLTDAAKANTDAIDAQRKQYETLIAQDYRSQYNVSQSQYAILAQAISDVANGQIGQRLGLNLSGLRSAPGAVART